MNNSDIFEKSPFPETLPLLLNLLCNTINKKKITPERDYARTYIYSKWNEALNVLIENEESLNLDIWNKRNSA